MKKNILITSLMLTAVAGLMSACATKPVETTAVVEETSAEVIEETTEETKEVMNDSIKAGLGITLKANKTKNAEEDKDGTAQLDATVAAVLFDKDGKILDLDIDVAQTKVNVSKEGKILTDLGVAPKTKKELGDAYDMRKASGISKEWYEQIEVLENYFIGKTVAEIESIPVDDKTAPTEADLTSSVTIKIGGYIEAIKKAEELAVAVDAGETDKVSLAINSSIDKSKDFSDGDEGVVNISSYYAMTTVDSAGIISSALIDASRVDISFDDLGAFEVDEEYMTKQELGESYGMKSASSIAKEWDEQADAIAKYVIGKNLSEIEAIEVAEDGKVADQDLVSSATLAIEPFKSVVLKAVNNVK